METIFGILMVLIMVLCVLMIIVVLVQNPKGGGLSSTFGASSSQMFGVQETNDFLNRSTWILSSSIVVLMIFSSVLMSKSYSKELPISAPSKKEVPAPAGGKTESTPIQLPSQKAK